jgi:hypothetical protein
VGNVLAFALLPGAIHSEARQESEFTQSIWNDKEGCDLGNDFDIDLAARLFFFR